MLLSITLLSIHHYHRPELTETINDQSYGGRLECYQWKIRGDVNSEKDISFAL